MKAAAKRAAPAPGPASHHLTLTSEQRDCVELVRTTFVDHPRIFDDFVEIVREYERSALDTAAAIRRVARLFRAGHRALVLKFNLFLPKSEHITEEHLDQTNHPAFLLPAKSYTVPKRARIDGQESPGAQPATSRAEASASAAVPRVDFDVLKREPVYSLLHPGVEPSRAEREAAASASMEQAVDSLTRVSNMTDELPRLVLPGDRVMVDMNHSTVHKDSELNFGQQDLRHPEFGRNRDLALDQLLLDHVMAERFSRRAGRRSEATGAASDGSAGAQVDPNDVEAGPRWEPAVVLGSSRDMLALNTYTGDKIYVINTRAKPSKAFNDISAIHTCHHCKSRMRVPRPCDVLICFQCKTKIKPPAPLRSSFSPTPTGRSGSRVSQTPRSNRTNLPLRAIAPMSPEDFVGHLKPDDEVEVQVVYKHAHRATARAWVMAKVVGRTQWTGCAEVLQLLVPYPTTTTSRTAGVHAPRGVLRDDWRDFPLRQTRLRAGASSAHSSDDQAEPQPTLELPAGNRLGSATVELPSLDGVPSAGAMPDPVPILVSTELTPLCERAVQCQRVARDHPHDLAEMHILVSDPPSPSGMMTGTAGTSDRMTMMRVRSMRSAVILSFVPGLQRHVVAYSETEVKLIDLKSACFVLEPSTTRIYHPSVLSKPRTHIKDCPVCFEPFDWSSLGRISMSCHPRECCSTCLSSWAEGQITEGKIFVRCPAEGCKKHLALNQVKQVVARSKYNSFVSSIREVHREAARAEQEERTAGTEEEQKAFREWVTKTDVRFCIGCFARIEKNKGCNHMTCWRCGTEFQWESAPLVSDGLPNAEAAACSGSVRRLSPGGADSLPSPFVPSRAPVSRPRAQPSRRSLRASSASSAAAAAAASSLSMMDMDASQSLSSQSGPSPKKRRRVNLSQFRAASSADGDSPSPQLETEESGSHHHRNRTGTSAAARLQGSPRATQRSNGAAASRLCPVAKPAVTGAHGDQPRRYITRAARQSAVAVAVAVAASVADSEPDLCL